MKKLMASFVLGVALLAACGTAVAEPPRSVEPRWGIQPEKTAPSILDFARWLSEKARRATVTNEPVSPPAPNLGPPIDEDAVCLDRWHCPIG